MFKLKSGQWRTSKSVGIARWEKVGGSSEFLSRKEAIFGFTKAMDTLHNTALAVEKPLLLHYLYSTLAGKLFIMSTKNFHYYWFCFWLIGFCYFQQTVVVVKQSKTKQSLLNILLFFKSASSVQSPTAKSTRFSVLIFLIIFLSAMTISVTAPRSKRVISNALIEKEPKT